MNLMTAQTWTAGEPCESHDDCYCMMCRPLDERFPEYFVLTTGWSHTAHRDDSCIWLGRGQGSVKRRGGVAAPLRTVEQAHALQAKEGPCLHCFPWARGRWLRLVPPRRGGPDAWQRFEAESGWRTERLRSR